MHEIEQKALYFSLPIIVIILFTAQAFIILWLGQDNPLIYWGIIFIGGINLITTITMPNYQFLMAKNLVIKTTVLQLTNVITNSLLILIFYKYMGYYAAILGNVGAIATSFLISLYYQKKYLNSLIFDSIQQFAKVLLSVSINIILGYTLFTFLSLPIAKLLIIPPVIILSTILIYRTSKLLNYNDITRFFGSSPD